MSERPDQAQSLKQKIHLNRCPYCHDSVEVEESAVCQGCLARHHSECWEEHGVCASCGEGAALAPREASRAAASRPDPLVVAPAPLTGSRIQVEREEGKLRLSFPGVRNLTGNRPRGAAMFLGFVLAFVAALVGGMVVGDTAPAGSLIRYALQGAIGASFPFLVLGLWGLWGVRREARHPPLLHLELTPDRIRIDRPHRWREAREESLEVPKSDVGNLQFKGGILTIDMGAERVPLTPGPFLEQTLSAPEKEWLFGVLTRWRNVEPSSGKDPKRSD